MPKKDFKLLLALSDQRFAKRVAAELKAHYTVMLAKTLKEFSDRIHQADLGLIIIDYQYCGMKAEDVYQGIELLHPNSLFVIYTDKDKQDLAMRLWKRRAMDYIFHTNDAFAFAEEVHKCVRWIIQKAEAMALGKRIDDLADAIKILSQKIEKRN